MALMEVIADNNGDREKVTISKTLEIIKKNYNSEKEKNAITGETLGDEEDKFPGDITYTKPASKISKDIIVTVDSNLNVSGYVEEPDGYDSIPKEDVPESGYAEMGDIYYYEPDLSGFNPEATYYVTYDENGENETIYGRIDRVEKPTEGWHNYGKKLWANVVTVTESDVTYWTWVPRYKYGIEGSNSKVYFVDLNNKCKMKVNGVDQAVDVSSYELPESFKFAETNLKGYWMSKYEVQLSEKSGLEQIRANVRDRSIEVGTTNPSGLYTIYVNGVIKAEHQSLDTYYKIDKLKANKVYDICVYSETNNRMVGRKRKMLDSVINVDTSGFEPSKTYYVTYDKNGNESIAGRMDKISEPIGWYNYEDKIWANLVTVNDNDVTYWTYIPRYQCDADSLAGITMSDVEFIPITKTKADGGYVIPESFTFNGQQLSGYWMSKYEIQISEASGLEQLKLTSTSSEISVTTTMPSGKYSVYVNGEKNATGVTLPYTIKGLKNDTDYDVCLYSEDNSRMVGSRQKSTMPSTVIKVDLSGFNPDCTYYVTYDDSGENEQIGDKIKLDSKGNATNMPEKWYDYDNKKWANIVTKGTDVNGNELITYWTYIPRYEYDIDGAYNESKIAQARFIPQTQTTADSGFTIPESFTFGGQQLAGYWMSKYEVQGTID